MDSYPVTARSLGRTYYVDGDNLERNYKNHLSDFRAWSEQNHAEDWNLLVENMGTHLSIDETSIDHVVYVFLTNKDGHGKKKCLEAPEICREASEDLQGQETWAQACTC